MSDRTRTELTQALGHLSFTAQRDIPRVGNDRLATPWDKHHRLIDEALTLLELATDAADLEPA